MQAQPHIKHKHRHATHARVIFFFGGGGGHCGSNEILCFVEKRNWVHCICDMTVFRCDKKYQMFTLLKEKQYQVTFLCEKNKNHQSISNKPLQKIFCGLCSLIKRNGIAFMPWLHSFMRKTKVSFYITQLEEPNHQSIPNNSWQKIFCGLCSMNKRKFIGFVPWLHSFMA